MDIEELKKPLDTKHVKQRSQGNMSLSYIEAWHAIDEANRIFGHDGWSRETVHTTCISSSDRKIGNKDGFDVTYSAKVRITVGAGDYKIVREGTGHGNGISQNLGVAHENAEKEAESDAMKRALITFGYPFGLALYDKDKKHVVNGTERETKAKSWAEQQKALIADMNDEELLRGWIAGAKTHLENLETYPKLHEGLMNAYEDKLNAVKGA